MKLSDWAKKHGLNYQTVYRWYKSGNLPVRAYQTDTGTIIVFENKTQSEEEHKSTQTNEDITLWEDIKKYNEDIKKYNWESPVKSNIKDEVMKIRRIDTQLPNYNNNLTLNYKNNIYRAFNDLLDNYSMFWEPSLLSNSDKFKWLPLADKYILYCVIPGFGQDDVKITVKNSILNLNGKREVTENDKQIFSENQLSFDLSYPIPNDVSIEGIQAKFANGILQLHLPKKNDNGKDEVEIPISIEK